MANRFKFLIALIGLVLFCDVALAAKQYRCNGRVQYRPCEGSSVVRTHSTRRVNQGYKRYQLAVNAKAKPRVLKSTFRRVSAGRGKWNGVLQGKGRLQLRLLIYRNGKVLADKYMGKVKLTRKNSTTFAFDTAIPRGKNWSWKLLVQPLRV